VPSSLIVMLSFISEQVLVIVERKITRVHSSALRPEFPQKYKTQERELLSAACHLYTK